MAVNEFDQAVDLLEQVVTMQEKTFNNLIHSSLEYTYNQLNLACTRAKNYERAEEVLGSLINLKETLYG